MKRYPTSANFFPGQFGQTGVNNEDRFYTLPLLVVPGLNNSDDNHWQSRWSNKFQGSKRIELEDWHVADLDKWLAAIDRSIREQSAPVILVAHSFGALASACYAAKKPHHVAGLFLVAPADPQKFLIEERLPATGLTAPATLIGSSNDPWLKASKARALAETWQAHYLEMQDKGHINSASKLGDWQEGLDELEKLVGRAIGAGREISIDNYQALKIASHYR